jgi:two-component system, NtrC family, response regulator HydG
MKHVLIIDDDEKIRKIITIQLHKSDYRIFEAEDREQAMGVLGREHIDVVLCDIKMKDTSGFVILEEIKNSRPGVPVIMLTGFIDKKVSERAKELGSYDCITKPVRKEKLIETISRACGEA